MTEIDGPEVPAQSTADVDDAATDGGDSAAVAESAAEHRRASRRRFLIGGAAGGVAAVAAGAALLTREESKPELATTVMARRVGRVPVADPESSRWSRAPVTHVEMTGQVTALPNKATPAVTSVAVQALYDPTTIGFRLEWDDDTVDDLAIGTKEFRDACAVLLGPDPMNRSLLFMGSAEVPVTLLHWKADWQRDVDKGRQYPSVRFPNATFDYYPPLGAGSGDDVTFADYRKADATEWVPGLHVGNPMSAAARSTPIEKLYARGFGTAETAPTQNAGGRGVWKDGRWTVTLAKPLRKVDDDEFTLRAGRDYGLAIAVWEGQQNDRGAHKSPSLDYLQLILE